MSEGENIHELDVVIAASPECAVGSFIDQDKGVAGTSAVISFDSIEGAKTKTVNIAFDTLEALCLASDLVDKIVNHLRYNLDYYNYSSVQEALDSLDIPISVMEDEER